MLSKARRRAHRQLALARVPNATTVTGGSGSVITAGGSVTPGAVQPSQQQQSYYQNNWYWNYPYNWYWPYTYATYWPTYYAAPVAPTYWGYPSWGWGGNYWGYPYWGRNYWGYQRPVVVEEAVLAAA